MGTKTNRLTHVPNLLSRLQSEFPKKKRAFEGIMRQAGVEQTIDQVISPPIRVDQLPTFASRSLHDLSPMLIARFECAGTWQEGMDTWLGADEMGRMMRKKYIRTYHESLRENWTDSAPMIYQDSQLSLFGVTDGVPENLTYLVWCDTDEPEIWSYVGMSVKRFKNLEAFLKSQIQI